jgi:cytochrome P450
MMLSMLSCLYLVGGLFIVYVFLSPVYNYVKDPLGLRKYSSPNLLAAIFPAWLFVETMLERRSLSIHEQHKRLGDVIRVSPTHLMFNDPRAIKDIYGMAAISRMGKDTYYDRVAGEYHDLVGIRGRPEHAKRRKALTNAFALKTVTNMEPVIRSNAKNLLQRLDEFCRRSSTHQQETVNIRLW